MNSKERKLTVKQAIEVLGLGRTTIYSWIKDGKLRSEDTTRGKIIILSAEEEDRIRELNKIYSNDPYFSPDEDDSELSDTFQESSFYHTSPVQKNTEFSGTIQDNKESEVILEMLHTFNMLNEKLLKYSEQAGQVKLLTDSESRTREEYFRIIQENAVLRAKLDMLEKENKDLKESKKFKWFKFM